MAGTSLSLAAMKSKSVLVQSTIAFAVKGLGAVAAFLMNLVLARSLGVDEAGYFLLAFTVITFLSALARCGFDNVILRHTAAAISKQDGASVRSQLFRALLIAGLVSVVVSVALYLGAEVWAVHLFNKPAFGPVLAAISPSLITMVGLWLIALSLQGVGRVSSAILSMNVLANIVFVIVLLLLGIKIGREAAFAYSVGSWAVLAVVFVYWWRSVPNNEPEVRYTISTKAMLASAWPLWIVLLMGQFIQWTGQFVGGAYLPPDQIAHLAVAQRTALLVSFILMAVNMVVGPRFAALHAAGDMDGLRNMALTAVRLMALGSMPVVAVMLIFPGFLMGLFGEGFIGGALLLQVLAIGQFINVLTGSVGYLLTMSGHERDLRNTLLIVAPISVVITFILVPLYGAFGAALSTALAVGAQNLLAVYWVKRRLGFNTLAVWRSKSV